MADLERFFAALVALAGALDAMPMNRHEGCWELEIDEHWWLAVNGHRQPLECSRGVAVAPFACYVEFNGFPAGIIDAGGGSFAAGSLANLDAMVEAMERRTAAEVAAS